MLKYLCVFIFCLFLGLQLEAATTGSSTFQSKTPPAPQIPPEPQGSPSKPLVKPALPVMPKPFGMPGIVGFQNEKWTGSDYLGSLSHSISVSAEIIKTDLVPSLVTAQMIESRVSSILTKEEFISHADVKEGPPLPFIQILLLIYPVEKDQFAVFGECRLFEQIQVVRKNFTPSGYWQGITWESQNIISANTENLKTQIFALVDGLVKGFTERYKLFNPENKQSSTASEE